MCQFPRHRDRKEKLESPRSERSALKGTWERHAASNDYIYNCLFKGKRAGNRK